MSVVLVNGCGLVIWNTNYYRNLACLLIVSGLISDISVNNPYTQTKHVCYCRWPT